eukprot:scaffold982_cov169-Amphora_coffeaeformis.AAC.6
MEPTNGMYKYYATGRDSTRCVRNTNCDVFLSYQRKAQEAQNETKKAKRAVIVRAKHEGNLDEVVQVAYSMLTY